MPIGQSSPSLQDVFSGTISSGEITPSSPPTRSAQSQPDLLSDVAPIGSARGDGTQSSCMVIAIAVKAHEKMRVEAFGYVFNSLIQQENCKVVVISCLSRVQSELGHSLLIGDNSFNGISRKMLAAAKTQQKKNWDHFLAAFRVELNRKGIQLDLHIPVGRKSEDILVDAAKILHPRWVVLDSSWASFSGNQHKAIQASLPECNLVLMKNGRPMILQVTTQPYIPRDQENSEEPLQLGSSTSSPISRNPGSNPESPTITPETTSSRPITPIITTETPSSNLTSTSTRTTETPSTSNQIPSSNISTASSSSHQITSTIPRETSSPNQIISTNHQSTAIIPTEMSSSNRHRATPTIPSETSTSNGSTPTTPTAEASQTVSGASTRAVERHPSPTRSPVASQGLFKYLVDRVTSAAPLFPSLAVIPLCQSTATLSSENGGSPPQSPSTLSDSERSTEQPNRNTPLNPTLGSTADRRPRQSTVDQPNEGNSCPQNEDVPYEIALKVAIEASIRSARAEGVPVSLPARHSSSSNKRGASASSSRPYGRTAAGVGQSFAPSAPPLPSHDPSQNRRSTAERLDDLPAKQKQNPEDEESGRCVICWCAPAEAACVPCGHIAGCQSCLNKAQHWGCPVCRAKIRQVIKVYAV